MAGSFNFKMTVDVNGGSLGFAGSKRIKGRSKRANCSCSYSATQTRLADHYRTLRLQPGASEAEVKKSFRNLAMQYHPDVCKGSNCEVQFQNINEAYDVVMSSLREETMENEVCGGAYNAVPDEDEGMRGMFDPDYELWEEWMGWEGAGIRDYSSHINPYI